MSILNLNLERSPLVFSYKKILDFAQNPFVSFCSISEISKICISVGHQVRTKGKAKMIVIYGYTVF